MLNLPQVDEPAGLNEFPVLYWNHVALEMNRLTTSLGGPQGGPTMSSRALGLIHLAMHDAYFAVLGKTETSSPPTYLPDASRPPLPGALSQNLETANAALTAAAMTMLDLLYGTGLSGMSIVARDTLAGALTGLIKGYGPHINTLSTAHEFGVGIALEIHRRLAVKPGEIGAGQGRYEPKQGRFKFRDEPVNSVRRVLIDPDNPSRGTRPVMPYHGPYYGKTVPHFAVGDPDGHRLAQWPEADYETALEEVARLGGDARLSGTKRTPDETVAAYFWAYDGVNLIGTPPRLYNQILRVVAWQKRGTDNHEDLDQTSEFVRLFALANTAMADAGKFAWLEKYNYELWRPLSGVREHDTSLTMMPPVGSEHLPMGADPFWVSLGAPETNSHKKSFKPPFPAYPSGHATFGAACFQITRLFYKSVGKATVEENGVDDIAFYFVSDELNGISRDLDQEYDPTLPIEEQPGTIRTRIARRFPSLWHAIFENAFSRVYLGVHWRFDAAVAADIKQEDGTNKMPEQISYSNVWTAPRAAGDEDDPLPIGGIPLGLGIANDIFAHKMRAPDSPPLPSEEEAIAKKEKA